jgi:hypothetical protein
MFDHTDAAPTMTQEEECDVTTAYSAMQLRRSAKFAW